MIVREWRPVCLCAGASLCRYLCQAFTRKADFHLAITGWPAYLFQQPHQWTSAPLPRNVKQHYLEWCEIVHVSRPVRPIDRR